MARDSAPLCFQCGQATEAGAELNQLPGGEPCPACRERLLDLLPPLLPGLGKGLPEAYGGLGGEPYGAPASGAPQGDEALGHGGSFGPDDPIAG